MISIINRLKKRNSWLTRLALAHGAAAILLAVLVWIDAGSTPILGINRWIKPMKFAGSIAIFAVTMAWILGEFPKAFSERIGRKIGWMMIGEIVLITMQSLRGVPSHFNRSSAFDIAVFSAMGIMIVYNTVLCGQVLRQTWLASSVKSLAPGYLAGIRLGLIILILGSLEGLYMSTPLVGSHTIGAADGGPGLPILNWSTQAGDLRVFHFLALHGLQVMLLLGLLSPKKTTPVVAGFLIYAILATLTLIQALNGSPLWAH